MIDEVFRLMSIGLVALLVPYFYGYWLRAGMSRESWLLREEGFRE